MVSLLPAVPQRHLDIARLELTRLTPGPQLTLASILQRICETAAESLEVERVGIWFYTSDRTALRCTTLYERSKQQHSEGATLQVLDFPAYFESLENRRSIPAEDAAQDPRTKQLADAYLAPLGIASLLDAPIFREGKVIGVICLEHTGEAREWSTEERDFAGSLADCIALKLKSCDLRDAAAVLQQTDEMLFAVEKAETLARVAAGAAHDFKNILTVIIGFAHELSTHRRLPSECREIADTILLASERGTALVQEMITFGRSTPDTPSVVNTVEVIERAMALLSASAGSLCPIQFQHDDAVGRVFIDPARLERVMMNLVINARDAMPRGGTIRIRVGAERVETHTAHRGVYTCISVADTGVGIDEAVRARIFEPFFSTKSPGEGNGLGLAIVKKIVEKAGGLIRIDSVVGKGTTFQIYLPRVSTE